jgi:hypothetical protein
MTEPQTTIDVQTPDSGNGPLGEDAACSNCWYNLSGSPRAGKCPECGGSYRWIRGRALKQPPSRWRAALIVGWPLLLVGLLVLITYRALLPPMLSGILIAFLIPACMLYPSIALHKLSLRSVPSSRRPTGLRAFFVFGIPAGVVVILSWFLNLAAIVLVFFGLR